MARLVPIWMKIEPISAATKAPTRGSFPAHSTAAAVPTNTGAIAAGSVRGRAAISQILMGVAGTARSRAGASPCNASRPSAASSLP